MREISKIENDGSPLKCVVTSSVEDDSEWLLEDAFSIGIGINLRWGIGKAYNPLELWEEETSSPASSLCMLQGCSYHWARA
jgi:hypothetical protein